MMRLAVAFLLQGLLVTGTVNAQMEGGEEKHIPPPTPRAEVIADLVELLPQATRDNSPHFSPKETESCGGVKLPGIFLHPPEEGMATLEFPPFHLDRLSLNERYVLLVALGIRDGVPFGAKTGPIFDGVRFIVRVNDDTRLIEEVFDAGWKWRVIDISDNGGNTANVTLATEKLETTNYDWAVFGAPMILRLNNCSWDEGPLNDIQPWEPARGSITLAAKEYVFPARLEAGTPYASRVLAEEGKSVRILLPVRNAGFGYYTDREGAAVQLEVSNEDGSLRRSLCRHQIPNLAPGEKVVLKWEDFVVESPGKYHVRVEEEGEAFRKWGASGEFRAASWVARPEHFVGNELARILFVAQDGEVTFGRIQLRSDAGAEWQTVASIFPLADIAAAAAGGGEVLRQDIAFPVARCAKTTSGLLRMLRDVDLGGVKGTIALDFRLDSKTGLFHFEVRAKFDGDVDLYRLGGPRLAVGEGSFSSDHEMVLFPGLEYFGSDDHSSSLLDAEYPLNLRRVPHPRKVTIPLMSIQHEDILVALLWQPHAPWYQDRKCLAAFLDVPPDKEGLEYSRMNLFAPSVPDYIPEHAFEAGTPCPVEANVPVRVAGNVYLEHRENEHRPKIAGRSLPGSFGLSGVRKYLDVFGLPEPVEPPRPWKEEKALSRKAWLDTVWVESEKGWRHANAPSWGPFPSPGYALLVLLDAYDTADEKIGEQLFERVKLVREHATKTHGPGVFSSGTHCHILWGEAAFLMGNVLESIERWHTEGDSILRSQEENGGWGWHPNASRAETANLGQPGEQRSGTIAVYVFRLLKLARVTGDPRFLEAGLRGLARMEEFRIPRGAQGWEVPLHCGDILASAWAVRANVEAFKLTGEQRYLDQARYWAWSGIPFVYLWNDPDIPSMLYNTTSIFGATHFVHSWIGVPVVWCGLVYAYGLQELAAVDSSFPWLTVAEGITCSAQWQQYEEDHPSAGCYPDSYNLIQNRRYPVDINPEDIMVNAFALQGMDPEIVTHVVPFRGMETRISGILYDFEPNPLTISPRLPPGAETYFFLTPVSNFESITYAGRPLREQGSLQRVPYGYRWDRRRNWLEIKITVRKADDNRLAIR